MERGAEGGVEGKEEAVSAAEDWISIKVASPVPRKPYLVAAQSVGVIADVAWFEGLRAAGGLWWVMTNADFPASAVTHLAALNMPECQR